jgi:hypothetical protein
MLAMKCYQLTQRLKIRGEVAALLAAIIYFSSLISGVVGSNIPRKIEILLALSIDMLIYYILFNFAKIILGFCLEAEKYYRFFLWIL